MEVEHGTDAEIVTSVPEANFRFHGEGESHALVGILQEQLSLLEHSEPGVRGEALVSIASHLDLTREVKTREELVHFLKIHLWKEEDPFLVQNLVRVLVDVALVPLSATSRTVASSVLHRCACVDKSSDEPGVCESCGKTADLQIRDGLVSSTSSPLKRKAHDGRQEKWLSRVESKFAIAKSVAQLVHAYLATKDDHVELSLESAVRVQLLHSLLKIGEKTDDIVTWESLGVPVRRYLRSSNPKVRALVLRLLVESVQENVVISENAEEENAKRRRVGNHCPGSTDIEMKSAERLKGGEILLSSLLNYMKDPYPAVRETALRGLMKLHSKGYELTSECCKMATSLFRDSFEYVRIAAIEMVSCISSFLCFVKFSIYFDPLPCACQSFQAV